MRGVTQVVVWVALIGLLGFLHGPVDQALAQVQATGMIQGTVRDADGAPLPGVQVLATSPALIGEQMAYTGQDGSYRIPLLPPGIYTLTFQLRGFTTVRREDVDVGVRRTSTIDASLALTGVEETVTVTGKSPLVDLRSTKRSSEISDDYLNTLPEPRGVGGDLMQLSPDASSTGSVHGNNPSFFGAPASNAFLVDGVNVTDPEGGYQFPFYSPDWFEVREVTASGAGAEFGKTLGAVYNVVTKSGGNAFHGEVNYFFQNNSFIGDNTEGISSERTGDFLPPRLNYRHDFTINIGGPVKRDKLWFFAGYQFFNESLRTSTATWDKNEDSDRFFGKLTWQANANNRLIASAMADTYTHTGIPQWLTAPEATLIMPSLNFTPNITWNSVLGPDAFLEVKYSGFYGFFDLIPISEGPAYVDLGTWILSGAYYGYYTFDRARSNVQGNLTYYAEDLGGDHSFRFGAEWEQLATDDRRLYGEAENGMHVVYFPYFGEPYLAYTLDPDLDHSSTRIYATSFFAQDDWTVGNHVTLNLGIRYDHWGIGWPDAERPDTPDFDDWAPRAGINIDLLGDGRASVHAFWGRFYEQAHGSIFVDFDPKKSADIGWYWSGSDWVEFGRFDPLENMAIDPNLSNTYDDQFTTGLDYQLLEDLAIGLRYVRRDSADTLAGTDVGSTFVPIQLEASNGTLIDMWKAEPRDEFILLVNNPNAQYVGDSFRTYNGFQIRMNKRLADNWALQSSLMIQKAEGNVDNGRVAVNGTTTGLLTPNRYVNRPGELRNSRRFVFKANGSYLLPDPIRTLVGLRFDWARSRRWSILERFSRAETGGLRTGDRTVPIEQLGSRTIDNLFNIDLRLEKKFQLPGAWGDVGLVFDVFNLTNESTVNIIEQRIPYFGEPLFIVFPREYRLGLRWLF